MLLLVSAAAAAPAYTIRVEGVQETCLLGEVDAAWADALMAAEGLVATHRAMLCAMDLTWEGRRFQEAVFTLEVAATGDQAAGWYLLSALNTRAFFAWVERSRNRSPYWPGKVVRDPGDATARLSLAGRRGGIAEASCPAPAPEATAVEAPFQGPIQLPERHWFDAEFSGGQRVWDFRPGVDTWSVGSLTADPMATALHASGFVPKQWAVREAGVHAKTDTQGPRP